MIWSLSTHGRQTWSRSWSPFQLFFGHGPLLVQMNLHHSQALPYEVWTLFFFHYLNSLYVEHHTEYHFYSLVLLFPWETRTQDLPISNQILYHYTIKSDLLIVYEELCWAILYKTWITSLKNFYVNLRGKSKQNKRKCNIFNNFVSYSNLI